MLTRILIFLFCTILLSQYAMSQAPVHLQLPAVRAQLPVKIDGLLNDSAWKNAAPMSNLVEFRPVVGAREEAPNRTETWIMYNDEGIYFGGYCHERKVDSISAELKGRDGFGSNDYIGIIFDTYLDKLNGFEYFLTPLNEQWDAKMSSNGGEDFSWNAVWQSAVVMHNDGWSFEIFIPFSAIRFGKKDIQNWGINITRRRRKTEQQYTWNPIDPNVNGFLTQEGVWVGLSHIKPPLRLEFYPYFSVYANHFPSRDASQKSWKSQLNGGMDLKYGINQAFTLDMTLVPDFGQVQSDNQVLNLTPFEVRFNEYRSFFTEGTELFSKGNLFYSRRIGGTPLHAGDVNSQLTASEKLVKNPTESRLINASKISGRTQGGLGIGFLNAITQPQYALAEDSLNKSERKIETNPLTNYNILVLDQTLKNNSSVTLVNTSVLRGGKDYDADVTAGLFELNDKKNTWNVGGKLGTSALFKYDSTGKVRRGYNNELHFGKVSGHFTFNIWQEFTDTKYSSNDMGYFTNNNYIDRGTHVGYAWTTVTPWYNRIFINFNAGTSHLFAKIDPIDTKFQMARFNVNANLQTKKLSWIGAGISYRTPHNDFYEPRNTGWFFRRGGYVETDNWYERNFAKRFYFNVELLTRHYLHFYNMRAIDLFYNQSYRFNNKFSLGWSFSVRPRFNSIGYTWSDNSQVVFGRRKENSFENTLGFKYNFNNMMGITLRVRHYLSTVQNQEYFQLQQLSGKLTPDPTFHQDVDRNVNYFNVDMVYTWQFAPGSFLNIVWKDAGYTYQDQVERNYFKNLGTTLRSDQNNNFSVKVIYFLDYLHLKKRLGK